MDDRRDATTEPIDPALNYPRGNRLGIRHPRPTVVIVVAVLVVLGGAFAWQAVRPESWSCETKAASGPVAPTADEAFQAWWGAGGARDAQSTASSGADPVAEPQVEDFAQTGERTWEWPFRDDAKVVVQVTDEYAVGDVNRCDRA